MDDADVGLWPHRHLDQSDSRIFAIIGSGPSVRRCFYVRQSTVSSPYKRYTSTDAIVSLYVVRHK
jgi:hypothetical protein